MASQRSPRPESLRKWLRAHDITLAALGKALGVSDTRARELIVADTIPTWLHARASALGIPVELLPPALDKKRGPKPKVPRFPGLADAATTITPPQGGNPATEEGSFA